MEGAFFFLFILKVISYANTLCGIYNVQIIVYRAIILVAHRRDNSRIVRKTWQISGGRFVNRPYEYTIKLIKSSILIRREATPNLFTLHF